MNVQGIASHSNTETVLNDASALLRFQQTLAEAVNQAGTAEAALQATVDLICEFTGWPVGHAQFAQHGSLVPTSIWHIESPRRFKSFLETARKDVSAEFSEPVLKDGKPIWVENFAAESDSPWLSAAQEVDLQSGGAFPICFGNDVVAVLEFYASSPSSPDEQLLQVLHHAGTHLGLLIECRRTKQALQTPQVTGQKPPAAAGAQLAANEALFQQMGEVIGQVFWLADPSTTRVTYVSPAYEKIWGRKCESLYQSPQSWRDAIHPEDRERVISSLPQPLTEKFSAEYRILRPDGSVRLIWDRRFPVRDPSGTIYQVAGVAKDITERRLAQTTLQEKEERYRLLVEQSADGICLADHDGNIIFCNSRCREMLGYSAEEWEGLNIRDTYPPDEVAVAEQRMRDVRPGQTIRFEREMRRKDGTCFPVEVSLHAVKEGLYQAVTRNITERRLAQLTMQKSEEKYRRLIELSPDAMYLQVNGRIVLINPAGIRLLGAERPEQILGKQVLDFIHPDHREIVKKRMQQIGLGQEVPALEEKYLRLDGSAVDVEVVAAPQTYLDQPAAQVIVRDISERKRAEAEMNRDRTLLHALIETIPDRIYVKDMEARFVLNNIAHIRALGAASQDEVKGKTDFEFRPADIAAERMADDRRVLESGEPLYNREEATIRADGKDGWNLVNKLPLRDAQGKIIGLVGTSRDITELKRVEEELRAANESFQRLAAIVESSDDAIVGKTMDGMITSWNHGAERIYGYTSREAIGKSITFLTAPDHADEIPQILERIRRGESVEHYETVRIRKDGQRIAVSLTISPIKDSTGRIVGASSSARDITEHKRAEEKLSQNWSLLSGLINAIPDRIYAKDTEARFILNNLAHLQALGAKSQVETVSKTDFDFRPADVASKCMADDQQVLQSGQPLHNREEQTKLADGRPGWILVNKVPLRDADGNVVGLVGISRDITERKEADEKLRTYADKLERSNRDLQDFAYIASHDLQEPLRKIQAFGDRLKAKYNDVLGDTGRDYLARMFDAAGRMQTLINDLLSFSRVTTKAQPFAPVDLDKILREVLSDLEVRIEQTHGRVDASPLGMIDADALQMRQLFQNLIGNALKFHKEDESPVIRIQGGLLNSDSPPRLEITFADNGIGFDQKYADRIFVIFQRLHGRSQYEGTGVGLAVCKKIVERHGGVITAESKEGEGATFRVLLPFKHSNGEETT